MHPLTRVLETVLYADDLEAAEGFYRGRLGLEVDSRKAGLFVFQGFGGHAAAVSGGGVAE